MNLGSFIKDYGAIVLIVLGGAYTHYNNGTEEIKQTIRMELDTYKMSAHREREIIAEGVKTNTNAIAEIKNAVNAVDVLEYRVSRIEEQLEKEK